MNSEIAAALREIADIDEAEGGNPHVIAKEREAASHIEALEAENERFRQALAFLAKHIPDDVPWFELHERAVLALSQAKE